MIYELLLTTLLLAGFYAPVPEKTGPEPDAPKAFIYRSGDLGLSWQPVRTSLPDEVQVRYLESRGDGLVAATEDHGMYTGNKDAADWKPVTPLIFVPNQKIRNLQAVGNELYTNLYENGFYVSADGGNIWVPIHNNLPEKPVRGMWKHGKLLLAGTDYGIFRTSNQGKTWQKVFDEGQVVSFVEQNGILIGCTFRGIIRSVDQGRTWTWVLEKGAVYRGMVLEDRMVVVGGNGEMYMSADVGKSWGRIDADLPAREGIYDVVKVQGALICSRPSGLYRSFDWGKNWELVLETPNKKEQFFNLTVIDGVVYSCVGFVGC